VFLAIRDAIAAAAPGITAGAQPAPPLRAPATPEAILDALEALQAPAANELATQPATQPATTDTTA
jgi:xanthine dehydrogenase large subunit